MFMNISANMAAMHAASYSLNVSANNVANISTENFRASETRQVASAGGPKVSSYQANHGTDVASEMVKQIRLTYDFKANARVVRTQDEMIGKMIDIIA
jgi:flagellar hook protein FlgE